MVESLDRLYLKQLLEKKGKHDTGKVLDILPFLSKRTGAIRGEFNKILGEYIRNICGLKIDEKALKDHDFFTSLREESIFSEHIAKNLEYKNEDDMHDFVIFLEQYLFSQEEIKPIHPFLYNYIKVDPKKKNEFRKYAQFLNEVFVQNNIEIKSLFSNKESDDILTELILSNMGALKEEKRKKRQYEPLFSSFIKLYQEDLLYLSKYKDYFLTSFPLITHYYVFMYACQLILKFEQFCEADYDNIHPFYFALEWESINKRRKAADPIEGFKYIKEKSVNLFPHIHTVSHLSHNSFNYAEDSEMIHFIPYGQLLTLISEKGEEYEKDFLAELKQWIQDYSNWRGKPIEDNSKNIVDAYKVLFECLKDGMSTDVCEKYGKNIEDLGYNQFIKTRGSLGQVFNIKHEFLLLLTAVSVKNKRIPLNDLFLEFEKRGVAFDRYSKKEIITLFDNLNILDKKSDSGDAQYVKPIL